MLLDDWRVDPTALHSSTLRRAAVFEDSEIVQMLLDDGRADPTANRNEYGKSSVVRLLPDDGRADPAAEDSNC